MSAVLRVLRLITVEPSMVLYMMAFMTTNIVEQAFFVHKSCTVNHQFNTTICDNINHENYSDYNKIVQETVSDFHLYNSLCGHIGPVIIAMFMGAWSDKRGRKLPLLLGLLGKLYYSIMIIVNDSQKTWPLEFVAYTATLPSTITGADVAIFAAAFSYISDITTKESRTTRVTILEVCYLATMPAGIALGKFLFSNVTNRSYSIMFAINSTMLALSVIYTFFALKWRTNEKQRPLSEADNVFTDFFDLDHVKETFRTVFKKRPMKRRTFFLLLIFAMAVYTFQRDEREMSYLYFQNVLNWKFETISDFRTYQSALQDLVLLTAIPLLSKVFHWKDGYIIMLGAAAHSVARLFYANANIDTTYLIYIGGIFASVGPIVAPVIRSMVSKIVAAAERGKAFSMLSVADNAIPLISGVLYSKVYKGTLRDYPNMIFYLTILTQMLVFTSVLYIHCSSTEHSLVHEEEEIVESCLGKSSEENRTDEKC